MMACTTRDETRRAISKYFTKLRTTTTYLRGKDLKGLGIEPGPIYHKILDKLLDARLDHELNTRKDELEFVKRNWRI